MQILRQASSRPGSLVAASLRSVALSAAAFGCCVQAHAAATVWVGTSSHAFPLNPSIITNPVPDSIPIHVYVSLQHQNQVDLQATLNNLYTPGNPQFGQFLTPQQFTAAYSPSASQVASVTSYLVSSGFTNIAVTSNRMLITADASAAQVQKAFNTKIAEFQSAGKTVHAAIADVQVPASLGGLVQSVTGLQNAYRRVTNIDAARHIEPPLKSVEATREFFHALRAARLTRPQPKNLADATLVETYTAADLRTAYDEGSTPDGSQTRVAISTEGDDMSSVISDLQIAEADANLPYVPTIVKILDALPSPQDNSGDDEWDLDSQSSSGIAYNVHDLTFLVTTDLGDSLIDAYNAFVADPTLKVGNMSYGGCESEEALLDNGSLGADDAAFMQAVMQGQTWFASAGDSGADCGLPVNLVTPAGVPGVEYPASSPYVVAVGGTSLLVNADFSYNEETAWTATGGGNSLFETAPSWQSASLVVPAAAAGLRGVPDIAMNAGLNLTPVAAFYSTYDTVVDGAHESVIGTSLSSPLAMGVWSRFLSAHCEDAHSYGFAAPMIYALDTAGGPLSTATGFNDVTVGTNGAYVATTGWDYTTGFGSFDITNVNNALPAVSGCVADLPPVAVLTSDVTTGAAGVAVTFDGSQSHDPDGDALGYYVLDFGDGSPIAFSTAPTFPAHTYANAGPYTASLTVRDAKGMASTQSATIQIDVTGTPLACALPGQLLLTSPVGNPSLEGVDPEFGNGSDDLTAAYISEPANLTDELVFTIKVVSLAKVPKSFRWVTYFTAPDGTLYYVSMTTTASLKPAFSYGIHGLVPVADVSSFQYVADADATSNYNADGTISIYVPKSAFNLKTGDQLTGISTSVRVSTADDPTGIVHLGAGLTVDSAGDPYPYTLVGNDVCAADIGGSTSGGTTGGTSSGGTTGGSSGGSSGGSTGGTTGSTSGGTTTGGTSTGGSSGGSTGGTGTGGTTGGSSSGGTTGGASTGGSGGGSTGGSTTGSTTGGGTTTAGTTGGGTTTGGSSTGGVTTTGGSSGSGDIGRNHGGAFGWEILLALGSLAGLRRRRLAAR